MNERHLEPGQLSAYLDDRLDGPGRTQVEAHLASCPECREEAAAVTEVLRRAPGAGRRWSMVLVPTLAAAAVALLLLVRPLALGTRPAEDRLRDGIAGEGLPVIVSVSPAGAALRTDSVFLAWRSAGPGALYHLTVSDTAGDMIWQGETRDTAMLLPDSVRLDRGRTYLWHVDALLADGRAAAMPTQHFETTP